MNMVVSHWSANLLILATCAVLAVAHLVGMRSLAADAKLRGADRAAGSAREAVAFYAGLLVVLLALVSPVGYWSLRFIWVRSVQDVLLAIVAPSLIVLGAPWLPVARAFGRPARPEAQAATGPRGALGWLSVPVGVTVAFTAGWWAWHVPVLYDAALRHPAVYAAEVITYLGLGVAFWLQLIGSRPMTPRFPPLQRVMLLAGTVVTSTMLAMVLGFAAGLLYPGYLGAEHHVLKVVADQQVGGAVLWVLVLPPYVIAGVALLIQWLNDEESAALTTGFDRLLKPRKSAWPSRPGLR